MQENKELNSMLNVKVQFIHPISIQFRPAIGNSIMPKFNQANVTSIQNRRIECHVFSPIEQQSYLFISMNRFVRPCQFFLKFTSLFAYKTVIVKKQHTKLQSSKQGWSCWYIEWTHTLEWHKHRIKLKRKIHLCWNCKWLISMNQNSEVRFLTKD